MRRQAIDPRHAREALHAIDPGIPREQWHRIGVAALAAGLTVGDLIAWSEPAGNFRSEADVRAAFRAVSPEGGIGAGTLWRFALDAGWRPPADGAAVERPPVPQDRPQRAAVPAEPVRPFSTDAAALWASCEALAGPALAYLHHRRCALPPEDSHLRWHPALRHPSGHVGPALVALLTDAVTAEPRTLHTTWLRPDGEGKAPVLPARRLLPGHTKSGAVCRLWPDDAVTLGLGIGEGIESTLSLAHAFRPVWACIDAGNLSRFPVLAGIECLTIAADNDASGTGQRAANACAARWHAAGRQVFVVLPPTPGADLNDVAQGVVR